MKKVVRDLQWLMARVNMVVRNELMGACWEWTGFRLKGYGQITLHSDSGCGCTKAHRLSWELHVGSIPAGLCVLHRCDNRPCVRPDHLFLGTVADNNADRDAKGRHVPLQGERHGSAKMSDADVVEIRRLLAAGMSGVDLARLFGVSTSTISLINRGRTWKCLDAVTGAR